MRFAPASAAWEMFHCALNIFSPAAGSAARAAVADPASSRPAITVCLTRPFRRLPLINTSMILWFFSIFVMTVELLIRQSGCLRQQAVRVEHEFGGDALIELGVAVRRILQADRFGIDDLCDRQPVIQQRHHELPIVAQDGRLTGVEGVRLGPAKAEAK